MQFQSDISDADIKIPNIEELSATGAAFLAGMSANLYDDTVYNAISYRFYHSKMNSQVCCAMETAKVIGTLMTMIYTAFGWVKNSTNSEETCCH